jgi:FixJ family two-component response regulator
VPPDLQIAVIDDDESFRVALVESLSSLGYEANGYASAEEYIGSAGGRSFNCVVTDIHMPGMSGLELTQQLAAADSPPPVGLITARSDPNLAAKAAAVGAAFLLRKPFDINELVLCIRRAVEG